MSSPAEGSARIDLLVVEDDGAFAALLSRGLRRRGFKPTVAGELASARAVMERRTFDAAILDFNLPDGIGLDLIGELRRANEGCRIVVLSAYATLRSAVTAIREGASDYLVKPADIDEIEAILRGLHAPQILDAQCLRNPNEVRWEHIQATLRETKGNLRRTAQALDLHRRTLQRILRDRRGQPAN